MNSTQKAADEFRRRLNRQGKTITQWAQENGFERRDVYLVLSGTNKGRYGKGHAIAVAAGLKPADDVQTSAAA